MMGLLPFTPNLFNEVVSVTFDMEEVQVIPGQTAIGYIDGGFIGSFEHMLKMILYRNPDTYNIRDGAYHMMDPVGDILNSIEHQASAMISVTVNDKGEMFLREADPMSIISPNTPASLLAHVFRKNVNYGNLSSVRKEFIDGMLPNTRSVIIFKDAGSLKLVTRFSLREFLVHTRRISIEGYLKTFQDPFMQSLATDKLSTTVDIT